MKTVQLFCLLAFLLASTTLFSQTTNIQQPTSVNTDGTAPDASAVLDVQSTTQGFRMPNMTTFQRDAISSPAPGLTIYNISDSCFNYYTGVVWVNDCGHELTANEGVMSPISNGGNGYDRGIGIATDVSGNVYVTGSFQGTATFGDSTFTSFGFDDVFIMKYSPTGDFLWAKHGGGSDSDRGSEISVDGSGNVYVTGSFQGIATLGDSTFISSGSSDLFVLKYTPSGAFLWAMQFDYAGGATTIDASGNIFFTGHFQGTITIGDSTLTSTGGFDLLLGKYAPDGTLLWARQGRGNGDVIGDGISIDAAKNVYVTGYFNNTATFGDSTFTSLNYSDVITVKYAPDGTFLWAKHGSGNGFNLGTCITTDASDNVYVNGQFSGTINFGNLAVTSTGGYDLFTLKYASDGTILWLKQEGGDGYDYGRDINTDGAGNVLITGHFRLTATFGDSTFTSSGAEDVFILKYAQDGTFLWASYGGGNGDDAGYGICADLSGNVFVTGQYQSAATFGDFTLSTSYGNRDMFLVSYTNSGGPPVPTTNLSSAQDADSDPTNELITSASLNGSNLEITDAGGTTSVDLSAFAMTESDPEVGTNATNYLPKWNGTALVQSISVFENGSGNVGIGRQPTTNLLEVEGNASKSSAGDWLANSDARLKKNIRPLDSEAILQKMLALQGITYEWDDDVTGSKRPEGTMYGFTAQNIQAVFPELVTEDNLGFLQTPYGTYDAMTVEAIRALQQQIEELKTENGVLKTENNQLTNRLNKLEAAVFDSVENKRMESEED